MAKKVFVAISYGQGGAMLDAFLSFDGTGQLNQRVRGLGCDAPGPFEWDQPYTIAAKIKALPADTKIVVGGTSLGANEAPRVGALVGARTIDFMFGIQPSMYGVKNLITPNVKRATFFYNPPWFPIGLGLGSYQWQAAPGNRRTVITPCQTYAPHPGDNVGWIHDAIVSEIKKLMA